MYAHYINVGQGDCTLLEFSCGAVLIDAGAQNDTYANNLVAYLTAFFQDRPDLNNTLASVIITHNHEDHTHALRDIAQAFTVERLIENGQRNAAGAEEMVRKGLEAATKLGAPPLIAHLESDLKSLREPGTENDNGSETPV